MNLYFRDQVVEVVNSIVAKVAIENGLHVFLAGGAVRDAIIGRSNKDLDYSVAEDGGGILLANKLHEAGYADHKPVVFERFGTAKTEINGIEVEFVSFRMEHYTEDSRKPDTEHGSINDEVMRRDFTINALLYNLNEKSVVDLVGGVEDIKRGIIKTTASPAHIFSEDPLRMLRAIRQAHQLGFTIEKDTYKAIGMCSDWLRPKSEGGPMLSSERIADEFKKIMACRNAPSKPILMLHDTGLLEHVLPNIPDMSEWRLDQKNDYHNLDLFGHTLATLDETNRILNEEENNGNEVPEQRRVAINTAALLHDVGKRMPVHQVAKCKMCSDEFDTIEGRCHYCGCREYKLSFPKHQLGSVGYAEMAMRRLKMSNEMIDKVKRLIAEHDSVLDYSDEWTNKTVGKFLRRVGDDFDDLMVLTSGDRMAHAPEHANVEMVGEIRNRVTKFLEDMNTSNIDDVKPLLDGNEIMNLTGGKPGPHIGELKSQLLEEQLDGNVTSKDEAITFIQSQIKEIPEITAKTTVWYKRALNDIDIKQDKQNVEYACGPAVLKMIMEYYNVNVDEELLIGLTNTTGDKGSYHNDLIAAAKQMGFEVFVKDDANINDLKSLLDKNIPVIVDIKSKGNGHYVVVKDYNDKDLIVSDPAITTDDKYMNIDKFDSQWNTTLDMPIQQESWLMAILPPGKEIKTASIFDYPRSDLDKNIWQMDDSGPTLKREVKDEIITDLLSALRRDGYKVPEEWISNLYYIGSTATYQHKDDSDIDITMSIDYDDYRKTNKSDLSDDDIRNELIDVLLKINEKILTGTNHPINYFIRPPDKPEVISVAIYDIINDMWIVSPKHTPVDEYKHPKDYKGVYNEAIAWARRFDLQVGELRRDMIEYMEIKNHIALLSNDDKKKLSDSLRAHFDEVVNNLKLISDEFEQIKHDRVKAYESDEYDNVNDMQKSRENIVYKLLERYKYIKLLKLINKTYDSMVK